MKNFVSLLILTALLGAIGLPSAKAQPASAAKDPQFIYVLKLLPAYQKETNWTPETNKIVGAHFNRLKEFTEKGVVLMAGRTDYQVDNPEMFGIVVFTAKDLPAAREFMNADPAVQQKIMKAEVHPFSVALLKGQK